MLANRFVGLHYRDGVGVSKSIKHARKYLTRAAEAGDEVSGKILSKPLFTAYRNN